MSYAIMVYAPMTYWEKRKMANNKLPVKQIMISLAFIGYVLACLHR